jgi:hypothetical protein
MGKLVLGSFKGIPINIVGKRQNIEMHTVINNTVFLFYVYFTSSTCMNIQQKIAGMKYIISNTLTEKKKIRSVIGCWNKHHNEAHTV